MRFVEVRENVFVNLDNVTDISLDCDAKTKGKYVWVFYLVSQDSDGTPCEIRSKPFSDVESARRWLKSNVLNEF